jgi:hypothetical protein
MFAALNQKQLHGLSERIVPFVGVSHLPTRDPRCPSALTRALRRYGQCPDVVRVDSNQTGELIDLFRDLIDLLRVLTAFDKQQLHELPERIVPFVDRGHARLYLNSTSENR